MGPCIRVCTWTNLSSSNKTQRQYEELNKQTTITTNNCVQAQLRHIMDNKIQKDQKKPNATSEEPGQKQNVKKKSRALHTSLGLNTTQSVGTT